MRKSRIKKDQSGSNVVVSRDREKEREFNCLVWKFRRYIQVVIERYVDDKRFLDDIVQEVLIKVWKNLDRLPVQEAELKGWLYTTAKRKAIDFGRAYKRLKVMEQSFGYVNLEGVVILFDGYGGHEEGQYFPQSVCETSCFSDPFVVAELKAFINGLSWKHRDTLLLSLSGATYEEIARATSANIGTVRSRLNTARARAKQSLSHHL